MYSTGVIHGRFQPLHLKHLEYILYGISKTEFLYIGITNPDPTLVREEDTNTERSKTSANPFTYFERLLMITEALNDKNIKQNKYCIVPFPINIPKLWQYYTPLNAVFFLSICDKWGERKLELLNSLGLQTDVTPYTKIITGTQVRQNIYLGKPWEHLVPEGTSRVIRKFGIDQRIKDAIIATKNT